jgi:hypothetical protein
MESTTTGGASNWARESDANLRRHHYVLRGRNADGRGWVTYSPKKVEEYRRRTSGRFCLVLIVSDSPRWYAMPWSEVSSYFTDATKYQVKGGRWAWTVFEAELGGKGGELQMSDGRRDGAHLRIPAERWAQNRSVLDTEELASETVGGTSRATSDFDPEGVAEEAARVQRQIRARRGQPEFRNALLRAYGGECAISGCAVIDALEAAHVLPHRGPHSNHVQNGLLLRADLHTLFDLHRLFIDGASMTVTLDPELQRDATYASLHGRRIHVPAEVSDRPSARALYRHRKKCLFG